MDAATWVHFSTGRRCLCTLSDNRGLRVALRKTQWKLLQYSTQALLACPKLIASGTLFQKLIHRCKAIQELVNMRCRQRPRLTTRGYFRAARRGRAPPFTLEVLRGRRYTEAESWVVVVNGVIAGTRRQQPPSLLFRTPKPVVTIELSLRQPGCLSDIVYSGCSVATFAPPPFRRCPTPASA
jgi:hypothetical protein